MLTIILFSFRELKPSEISHRLVSVVQVSPCTGLMCPKNCKCWKDLVEISDENVRPPELGNEDKCRNINIFL